MYNFFVLFGNGNVICASRFPPWLSTRVNETNILQECHLHVNESNIGENEPNHWNLMLSIHRVLNISQHTTSFVIMTRPHYLIPSLFIPNKFEPPIEHMALGVRRSFCYFPFTIVPSNWIAKHYTCEFVIVLAMWKIFWLHVFSRMYVALWPWLLNCNSIPHGMEFSWSWCAQLPYTLVKNICRGSEKFTLSRRCEYLRELIMVSNFLLQDLNFSSHSKPNDLLCMGLPKIKPTTTFAIF